MPKRPEPQTPPDVERGDEIYFRHKTGPLSGKVLSRGAHGVTLEHRGQRHQVRWEDIHGHKVKLRPEVKVVDHGEDGMIVEARGGHRRFVHDPLEPLRDERPLAKGCMPMALLFAVPEEMAKALGAKPGLTLQAVVDKAGHQTRRWKRTGPDAPAGPHSHKPGDRVRFAAGAFKGEGEIVGETGENGAHVKDAMGRAHQVAWSEMTHHIPKPDEEAGVGKGETFSAAAYGRDADDHGANEASILKQFPPETAEIIARTEAEIERRGQTVDAFKENGEWREERHRLHYQILYEGFTDSKGRRHEGMLSPERIKAATPPPGQKPTFTILGGRGGSGKSWFDGKVYDRKTAITLDADEIKGMLPEFEGWNAHQVHEESGELFDAVTTIALQLGLNVVHDSTMKTADKAVRLVRDFKNAGYRVEAHYMHLPRQEAARRAVGRFLTDRNDGSGRYVPINVVLGMKTNEQSFDRVRPHVDRWSFRDNNVARGDEPKLIAEGGADQA